MWNLCKHVAMENSWQKYQENTHTGEPSYYKQMTPSWQRIRLCRQIHTLCSHINVKTLLQRLSIWNVQCLVSFGWPLKTSHTCPAVIHTLCLFILVTKLCLLYYYLYIICSLSIYLTLYTHRRSSIITVILIVIFKSGKSDS